MINFIICEDNEYVGGLIKSIINKVAIAYDFNYKITLFSKYNTNMKKLIHDSSDIKVYILDLELPNKTGIEIAHEIRSVDWDSVIIVSTSHDELEMSLLKQKLLILDFISKFDNYEKRLSDTLLLVIGKLDARKTLNFKSNKEIHRVKLDDILYVCKNSESYKTSVVAIDKKYDVRESLISISMRLNNDFIQTHRSCFVNKNKIDHIDYKNEIIYLTNGEKLNYLSRNYKKGLKELL